jgi:hypothetical protein
LFNEQIARMAPGWELDQKELYITDIKGFIFGQEMEFKGENRRFFPIFRGDSRYFGRAIASAG